MGEKIFTICPRHDLFMQDICSLAGEVSDMFLENVSSHFASYCFPTYSSTTYISPFLCFRDPVSHLLSFLFLSCASKLLIRGINLVPLVVSRAKEWLTCCSRLGSLDFSRILSSSSHCCHTCALPHVSQKVPKVLVL